MTLIVGIKCKDGIVVGADGAATFGSLGQFTIRQSVKKKLRILSGDQAIVGVSGHMGLGQRIVGAIEEVRNSGKLSTQKPHQAMTLLRHEMWKYIEPEIQIGRVASHVSGPAALNLTMTSTLAAVLVSGEPCLFQFDNQAMPELATDDLPFAAIGVGQIIADPFLAFLRRLYWPDALPSVKEGIFAAIWTIQHTILTAPGGIGEPIQIVTMEKVSGAWKARELAQGSLQESLEAVGLLEKNIAGLLNHLNGKTSQSAVSIPSN